MEIITYQLLPKKDVFEILFRIIAIIGMRKEKKSEHDIEALKLEKEIREKYETSMSGQETVAHLSKIMGPTGNKDLYNLCSYYTYVNLKMKNINSKLEKERYDDPSPSSLEMFYASHVINMGESIAIEKIGFFTRIDSSCFDEIFINEGIH